MSQHITEGHIEWPASPAKSEEPGSDTSLLSLMHALVESQTRLALAIEAQTKALDRMAESNQRLIRAMAEDAGESDGDEQTIGVYLNNRFNVDGKR